MVWEDTNYAFWRSGGSLPADSGRSSGLQSDAIRNITGNLSVQQGQSISNSGNIPTMTGALRYSSFDGVAPPTETSYINPRTISFDASLSVPTAAENRPVNRRFIIWKRTA
jgi:hypothetical protein